MSELTHIGPDGRARMVDVSDKTVTARIAGTGEEAMVVFDPAEAGR